MWLVTQATLIHGPKDQKPQYVVCLNYVVRYVVTGCVVIMMIMVPLLMMEKMNGTEILVAVQVVAVIGRVGGGKPAMALCYSDS